jgi:2-dehydropantoate 2-reductase
VSTRYVVVGPGAVGGVVGGRMVQHGHQVVLVARGAHREAIAERGLTVEWPEASVTLPVPVVASPAELDITPDDIVLVAVKSQDTPGVVEALATAAPPETPIVCLQNGVTNEDAFLRRFANVHAVAVLAPTAYLHPGVVQAFTREAVAVLDIGRWPTGVDDVSETVAAAFRSAGFQSVARPDIRRWKYTKLLLNLVNPVSALCRRDDGYGDLCRLAQQEGRRVLDAAGIAYASAQEDVARRGDLIRVVPIGERTRPGGSTWQSMARGRPLEVDYLNGEIVLLGRLHGVRAPVNELLQQASHEAVAAGREPGSTPTAALLDRLPAVARAGHAALG